MTHTHLRTHTITRRQTLWWLPGYLSLQEAAVLLAAAKRRLEEKNRRYSQHRGIPECTLKKTCFACLIRIQLRIQLTLYFNWLFSTNFSLTESFILGWGALHIDSESGILQILKQTYKYIIKHITFLGDDLVPYGSVVQLDWRFKSNRNKLNSLDILTNSCLFVTLNPFKTLSWFRKLKQSERLWIKCNPLN